jgi:hypothetical protein
MQTSSTATGPRNLPTPVAPDFARCLYTLPDALPQAAFAKLAADIEQFVATERNYVPTHKKGGTIAYETLRANAPQVAAFYQSPELHRFISGIVGAPIGPTPPHDQSSCSVLFYERPGDHIGWHYDHNFYRGRHFTVLLSIVNRGANGLSAARLMARTGGTERTIGTPPNTLVVFEGAKVLHKVTPLAEGERRVVLSMTFCTDNRHSLIQECMRRVKDIAFFGPRALWS